MNKLLELLGEEQYNALKKALGDDFEKFKQLFEDGEITEDDVVAKQKELDLLPKEEGDTEGGGTEEGNKGEGTEGDDGEGTKDAEGTQEEEPEEEPEEETEEEPGILNDGWLLEDGEVDYEKIGDEVLRNYIKGLNERLKQSEWNYKYNMAIMMEAMKSNMYDTSDADKYISTSDLTIDEDGNVAGVKEAFDKLRQNKPHLFKPTDVNNPLDSGFNPVNHKPQGKPRSYAEAVEQTRALI